MSLTAAVVSAGRRRPSPWPRVLDRPDTERWASHPVGGWPRDSIRSGQIRFERRCTSRRRLGHRRRQRAPDVRRFDSLVAAQTRSRDSQVGLAASGPPLLRREKVGSNWNKKLETLGRADKQLVLDSIRGDFQLVPSLRASADIADRELVRLTDQQCALFSRLAENARVIAKGGQARERLSWRSRKLAAWRSKASACCTRATAAILRTTSEPYCRPTHSSPSERSMG